jgi:hypothetical protein
MKLTLSFALAAVVATRSNIDLKKKYEVLFIYVRFMKLL